MCRWFAYLSNSEPCLLEDVLIAPAHSLSKQVHDHFLPGLSHYEPDATSDETAHEISLRNSLYNIDGFGVAWYTNARAEFGECDGPRPTVYKILRQPLNDPVYMSICANTATLAVFAHLRAASGDTAVSVYNNHPFHFGRWSFMHNGVVANFNLIKREISAEVSDEALDLVKGSSDSELLAALVFTYLSQAKGVAAWDISFPLEDVKAALELAITTIISIQRQVLPRKGVQPSASSLNIAITDGEQLLAVRFRNHATEHPPSLYFSTTAGVSLNRKYPGHPDRKGDNGLQNLKEAHEHGKHIIVASEPSTYKSEDWELIKKNECLLVGRDMVLKRVPVEVVF